MDFNNPLADDLADHLTDEDQRAGCPHCRYEDSVKPYGNHRLMLTVFLAALAVASLCFVL
jgi:hypothetical protein